MAEMKTLNGYEIVDAQARESINDLGSRVSTLESSGSDGTTIALPDYWESPVAEAVSKIKALQDAGGRDIVNFAWFSDVHWHPDASKNKYMENVGVLAATVMDECNIPLALMNGDSLTAYAAGMPTEDVAISLLKEAMEMYAPIGYDRLMLVRGNHDDVYGKYETVNYVGKAAPAKVWNALHRPQAEDFRRVFGGDGTYFYIDNVPQKVRFICLNAHFYDGEAVSGTTSQQTTGFGTEQLDWLENTALAVEDGWGIVIATHVPPTAKSVNGRTDYLGQYGSSGTSFRSIVNAHDNIIAIFCGHCHADAVVSNDLSCPIVTITSVVNTPYDADASTRVLGTTTETSLDIVSINKKTKTIHMTRLGYGSDRVVGYGGTTVTAYTVTNNLTNCTSSNSGVTVTEGESYVATITANSGYVLDSVTCTMGGSAVTVSGGVISIASVTGDIIITATAVEEAGGDEPDTPSYTNMADPSAAGWVHNTRVSSSDGKAKAEGTCPGAEVTNFILVPSGNMTLYVKGIDMTVVVATTTQWSSIVSYTAANESTKAVILQVSNGVHLTAVKNGDVCSIALGSKVGNGYYIRLNGSLIDGYTADDVVITLNEEIT